MSFWPWSKIRPGELSRRDAEEINEDRAQTLRVESNLPPGMSIARHGGAWGTMPDPDAPFWAEVTSGPDGTGRYTWNEIIETEDGA